MDKPTNHPESKASMVRSRQSARLDTSRRKQDDQNSDELMRFRRNLHSNWPTRTRPHDMIKCQVHERRTPTTRPLKQRPQPQPPQQQQQQRQREEPPQSGKNNEPITAIGLIITEIVDTWMTMISTVATIIRTYTMNSAFLPSGQYNPYRPYPSNLWTDHHCSRCLAVGPGVWISGPGWPLSLC